MKAVIGLIIICGAIIAGFVWYDRSSGQTNNSSESFQNQVAVDNVKVEAGKQVIEITAKGGYRPRKSTAQANMPTVIRFNTSGTFDCSLAVRIPSLGISKTLAQSGATDIDIGTSKPGTLKGTCGMGMYPFEINFSS